MSRRTLIAAAWSAPVVLAAVATPLAAASGATQPDASLSWSESEAVMGDSSVLSLIVPSRSPGIGSSGTILLTVSGYGYIPTDVTGPPGWTYSADQIANVGTLTSPAGGLTRGAKGFNVTWGELSDAYTIVATWQNDQEPGSISATITVGFGPAPTLEFVPSSVAFGGQSTLRLTVPEFSYAIGQNAVLIEGKYAPDPYDGPPFPAGTTVVAPTGWNEVSDPESGITGFQSGPLAEGVYEFVYTIGSGTTPVSPFVFVSVGVGSPLQATLAIGS